MSIRTTPPFRADHVGSFLRPRRLLDAREKHRTGELSAAGLRVHSLIDTEDEFFLDATPLIPPG